MERKIFLLNGKETETAQQIRITLVSIKTVICSSTSSARYQLFLKPQYRTIPVVISDENGVLFFGDPFEQDETTEVQSSTDQSQLTGEVPLSAELSHELHVEIPSVHMSQPQVIRTLLTDEDIEPMSADLYHPVYTLMSSAEAHQNLADPEEHQQEVSSATAQISAAIDVDTESIETDLETLLVLGDLGPLSADGINIDPFVDSEMEILLNDTTQASNALMSSAEHQLNALNPRKPLQVSPASFDSTDTNDRNVGEQRDANLVCPGFSGSDHEQPVESVRISFDRSLPQSGFSKYHIVNQNGQKTFKCGMCQKLFHSSSGYRAHRRIHTDQKPFQCDICSKEFHTSYNCQRHRRIHTGEKPFQCDLCPKMFRTSSDFRTHRRIHTGEKPFQCDICPKRFFSSSDYQKHRRIHTGEKPYQCDICAKQFRTSSDYQTHRRIHTGEKPFKCDICHKEFSISSNYQTHRRIHADDRHYICYWCNQDYCSKCSLIKHVRKCPFRNASYTGDPVASCFMSSDTMKWIYMQ